MKKQIAKDVAGFVLETTVEATGIARVFRLAKWVLLLVALAVIGGIGSCSYWMVH